MTANVIIIALYTTTHWPSLFDDIAWIKFLFDLCFTYSTVLCCPISSAVTTRVTTLQPGWKPMYLILNVLSVISQARCLQFDLMCSFFLQGLISKRRRRRPTSIPSRRPFSPSSRYSVSPSLHLMNQLIWPFTLELYPLECWTRLNNCVLNRLVICNLQLLV